MLGSTLAARLLVINQGSSPCCQTIWTKCFRRSRMSEVTIHLYCRSADGKIEDAQHTFDLSDFGGFLPSVGDKILDPGVPASLERHVPENRRLWTVVDRVFNPRDTKDFVALVIESCPVSDHEAVLLPPG